MVQAATQVGAPVKVSVQARHGQSEGSVIDALNCSFILSRVSVNLLSVLFKVFWVPTCFFYVLTQGRELACCRKSVVSNFC